ncbi:MULTISPECIES: hypothetical protein [unclassified Limnohabitans]|uniref:hypothetical protein n=1 Tax=unclassified Limnohabitans TaxID=2626134 RepID=UPI0011B23656|nr:MULTISPECIES: hypothetical protein [unclassified Limnohabitans]
MPVCIGPSEIDVGEENWQSIPANVEAFSSRTGIQFNVVSKGQLDPGKEYFVALVDRWLKG